MATGQSMDRTGVMSPAQLNGLTNADGPPFAGVIGGMNIAVTNASTNAKTVFRSQLIPADALNLGFNFLLDLFGTLGGSGADKPIFTLDAVKPDGTRVTLLTLTTAADVADEDDKMLKLLFQGKVTLEQVSTTSGKIASCGMLTLGLTTPVCTYGVSAAAGVSVDFRSGIHLEVQSYWDSVASGSTNTFLGGMLQVCNLNGGGGS